ncbi:MAG: xanthine dehydrogenase family protein molybdopterin-binding subunit [Myxococcota bacterium]|jgi:4-hydroxybenzoyl-CoA reductase alpha subunit|nr:xanthine dehydrogenase family protein molybdopterin-binding subunit [Myxococcota bacterium]
MTTDDTKRYAWVGKSIPKVDAAAKVRGKAIYTDDISLPGLVYAKIKGSTVPHGRIVKIDTHKAEALPGVLAVIVGDPTTMKPYSVNNYLPTEQALASGKVRYYGEGVAAVAALDEKTAERAVSLIEVEYEALPFVLDPREAMEPGKPLLHDFAERNINYKGEQDFGDVDKAFAESHLVMENHYYCSYVSHAFLEPQSVVADYDTVKGHLTVHTCIQLPHYFHQTLSRALELPMERIRVIVPTVGGGFGGKTEATPASLVACILSRKLGKPVKITYDREEVFQQNKGRHPAYMRMKMGFDPEGRITACDFDNTLDGGAHSSWGFVTLWFSAALTQLPYKLPNVRFRGRRIFTNKPTTGAQRCLGGVQVRMSMESLLDEAAQKLGIHPFHIRMVNAVETGHQTQAVFDVRHSELKRCIETVVAKSGFCEKYGKLPFGRGIGLACGHYSTGGAYLLYKSNRPHSTANIRVDTEAGTTVFVGATDIGQGSTTVLTQMVAEVLGLDLAEIHIVCQDTTLAPMDNGTYDSRVTYGAGHAVKRAAIDARDKLFGIAAIKLDVNPEQLECAGGFIYATYSPKKRIAFREAVHQYLSTVGPLFGTGSYTPPQPSGDYQGKLIGPTPAFGFTAQVAEIEVDVETGKLKIIKYWEAGDCGKAINPMSVEGQVEGGISMGLGQALFEEMKMSKEGKMENPNFHDYRIPTTMDMPEIDATIVESFDPTAPFGNKEVGEGPVGPVIPAILNAIYDAVGVRITEVPVTPERILRALGKLDQPSKNKL